MSAIQACARQSIASQSTQREVGEAIDKPADCLGVVGDVMEPQHEKARKLGCDVQTIGPDVGHAFIFFSPERAPDFLRSRL